MCLNVLPVKIDGRQIINYVNECFGVGSSHTIVFGDIAVYIEPLVSSSEGLAWVVGAKPNNIFR